MRTYRVALLLCLATTALSAPARADESSCRQVFNASDADGALNRPFVGQADLKRWVQGTVPGSLEYTFPLQRPIERPCTFTEKAWTGFSEAVKVDEARKKADEELLVLDGVLDEPPTLRMAGINAEGAYEWRIVAKIRPWFEGSTGRFAGEARSVRLVVSQVRTATGGKEMRVTDTW